MRTQLCFLLMAALVLGFGLATARAADAPQVSEKNELCLSCHNDPSQEMDLPDGKISVYVDPAKFHDSVHGAKLNCTDCHTNITDYPHPENHFKNKRDLNLALYESCKRCHFDNYTKMLEGIHYHLLAKGDSRAPTCVDCHGAHEITKPDQPKARVSQTCERCHQGIYNTYANSVHGKALVIGGNVDAPVCTDCHRAHDIEDPRTNTFLLQTPQICGSCHGDEKLMKKYGLSTDVVKTYLQDFHGASAAFHQTDKATIQTWKAVCTDCHGVHDIASVKDPSSPVLKANLVATCRKCHANATTDFPDAWLSHYEPSPTKAASVYFVKLFYKFFIPFSIIGLGLHIVLHVWRVATNR